MFENCRGCCLAVVLIPLLCCVLVAGVVIYIHTNAPDAPISKDFKASDSEARDFNNQITQATTQAANQGWFWLNFSECQLSSWMTLEGKAFADEHGHAFPFEDIQIGLDDGQMTVYAKLGSSGLGLPLEVIIEPQVDEQGKLEFDIEEAHLGAISVPKLILNNITAQLEDKLVKPFDDLPGNYFVNSQTLAVEDGQFVLYGTINR
jgi:hypothetical protein